MIFHIEYEFSQRYVYKATGSEEMGSYSLKLQTCLTQILLSSTAKIKSYFKLVIDFVVFVIYIQNFTILCRNSFELMFCCRFISSYLAFFGFLVTLKHFTLNLFYFWKSYVRRKMLLNSQINMRILMLKKHPTKLL